MVDRQVVSLAVLSIHLKGKCMNNSIVPFIFEGSEVRATTGDGGEVLFCGRDVATALGYENPSKAMNDHCKGVTKRYPLQTPGGVQQVRFITRSDLLRLIVSSKLESAQRFEAWVFEEVLPSIWDTGGYQSKPVPVAPALSPMQDAVASIMLLGEAMGRVTGVNPAIAIAASLTMIKEHTGIDTEPMRRCLPTAQGPTASMNPTRLAKLVGGGVTPQGVNCALESMGLQQKCLRGGWELTEAGREHGEMLPFSRNGHAGYQVLWGESVVPGLYDYFLGGMDA